MKKLAAIALAVLGMNAAIAQGNVISQNFTDFSQKEEVTKVSITGKMFEMFSNIEGQNDEEKEMIKAFSGVEGIEVLASEQGGEGFMKEALSRVGNNFEELMTVTEKDVEVQIHIDDNGTIVNEVIILVEGTDHKKHGWAIVDIFGSFDLNDVAEVARQVQVSGLEHFDGEMVKAAKEVNFYPNPASASTGATMTVPEELMGATCRIFDTNGKLVKDVTLQNSNTTIALDGLSPGNYVVTVNKGNAKLYSEKLIVR